MARVTASKWTLWMNRENRWRSSRLETRPATTSTAGSEKGPAMFSNQVGSARASASTKATISPRDLSTPVLRATESPPWTI